MQPQICHRSIVRPHTQCSARAAIVSSLVSLPLAIMAWLVTAAKLNDGEVSVETTGQDYPMLAGNLVALVLSALLCIGLSFVWPDDFDWARLKNLGSPNQAAAASSEFESRPDLEADQDRVKMLNDEQLTQVGARSARCCAFILCHSFVVLPFILWLYLLSKHLDQSACARTCKCYCCCFSSLTTTP